MDTIIKYCAYQCFLSNLDCFNPFPLHSDDYELWEDGIEDAIYDLYKERVQ